MTKVLISLINNPDHTSLEDIVTSEDVSVLFSEIREKSVSSIAKELIEVQPMDGSLTALFDNAKSRQELTDEGYEPVSSIGLMWKKKYE